jgi:hypothetical protein
MQNLPQSAQDASQQVVPAITSEVPINVANVSFSAQAWQVGAIVFLLFLLIITMASMRHHMLHWATKGAGFGIALGFVLALVLEGFLLLGGRTALTAVFAWKNAPEPVAQVLDSSRQKFMQVLGEQTQVPEINAAPPRSTIDDALDSYRQLNPTQAQEFIEKICAPKPR